MGFSDCMGLPWFTTIFFTRRVAGDQQSTRSAVQAAVQQGQEPAVVSATAAKAGPGDKGAAETLSFAVIHDRSWQSTSFTILYPLLFHAMGAEIRPYPAINLNTIWDASVPAMELANWRWV